MSGALPPLEHISADDHGPTVTVLVIIFSCASATSALIRVYVSINRRLAFGVDDAFCFAALVRFDLLTWRLPAACSPIRRSPSSRRQRSYTMLRRMVWGGISPPSLPPRSRTTLRFDSPTPPTKLPECFECSVYGNDMTGNLSRIGLS